MNATTIEVRVALARRRRFRPRNYFTAMSFGRNAAAVTEDDLSHIATTLSADMKYIEAVSAKVAKSPDLFKDIGGNSQAKEAIAMIASDDFKANQARWETARSSQSAQESPPPGRTASARQGVKGD
jgi:predicted ATPase with chaperone activity